LLQISSELINKIRETTMKRRFTIHSVVLCILFSVGGVFA
jgi:hypothetical protein